jgi:hypothetical protein
MNLLNVPGLDFQELQILIFFKFQNLLNFENSLKFLYNISIKERERKINTLSPFAENRRRTARLTYKKSITKT